VDTDLLERAAAIVNDNSKPLLIEFITKDLLTKLLSNWSYFSSINDHGHFVDVSVKLSKLTNLINVCSGVYKPVPESDLVYQVQITELRPKILQIYKDILNNYLKVIYRALSNNKPSLTNPVLRVLSHMVTYDQSIAIELLNTFDLTLSILPKLLIPTKQELDTGTSKQTGKEHLSVRYNFIKFWIELSSQLPYFHRKDLLCNNFKIMNNFWKHMIDADSLPTLSLIISFIDQKILQEVNFKRSTKCKILNENFMHKVQPLFSRIDKKSDEKLYDLYLKFLETLTCDSKAGLVFPNEKLWQTNVTTGITVQLNNKNFKIHNNLIYIFITTLKPWEAFNQMLLLLKILEANPELVPIYMNWMIQHGGGYHDPSLTSWWIGHTLLYTNILQLSIPKSLSSTFVSVDSKFNSKLILENIALAPISKSSLIKALECDEKILTQFALQLIMFTLKKLKSIIESGITCNKQEVVGLVFANLPDIANIVELYNKITAKSPQKSDQKLTKLTILSILKEYELLLPNTSSASQSLVKLANTGVSDIIQNIDTSSDFDLAQLDCFLSILSVQDKEQELKWWNSTPKSNSFFTCLVKLSTNEYIGSSFGGKILSILSKLTSNSLMFNDSLILSPILALIQSFKGAQVGEEVWRLLDEAISRANRTPYKYLDLSNKKYHDISLFVVVIFEQLKFFVDKDGSNITFKWFFKFLQYSIIAGESKKAIETLAEDYLSEFQIERYLDLLNFSSTLPYDDQDSLSSLMINTSNKDLVSKLLTIEKKVLITKLDLASTLLRLKLILCDDLIKNADSLIIELASKISNYVLSSDLELHTFVFTERFWETLLFTETEITEGTISPNKVLSCELFNELYKLIPHSHVDDENDLKARIISVINLKMDSKLQTIVSNFIWVLSNQDIKNAIENCEGNDVICLRLAQLSLERKVSVGPRFFHKLLQLPNDDLKTQVACQLIELDLVTFDNDRLIDEVRDILANKENYNLIKSFINSTNPRREDVLLYLINERIDDELLLCYISYSICLIDGYINEQVEGFLHKTTHIAVGLLSSRDERIDWSQLLVILKRGIKYVDDDTKRSIISNVLDYVQSHGDKFGFISEFAGLMNEVVNYLDKGIFTWIHKSMLYITKMFAEAAELTESFDSFVDQMQQIIIKVQASKSIWNFVPQAILNTQLEVFLNHKQWIKNERYLAYANVLILSATSSTIHYEKLLQIFANNGMNILTQLPTKKISKARFLSSLILYNLFNFNHSKCSTSLLSDQLLVLYLGSIRAEDVLLKAILIKIEAKISKSWITKVRNWEVNEELKNDEYLMVGEPRLITKDKSSLVVSISKNYINNSINHGDKALQIPESKGRIEEIWSQFDMMYMENEISINQEYEHTVYDPEFFLLLILNNEELVKIDKVEDESVGPKFDVTQLINSGILQYIVANVGNSNKTVSTIAKMLLQGVLQTLVTIENFKDANVYKVYISNILFSLRGETSSIPNIVWYIYSTFANILGNPGHFLYEKTFRYVLSTPQLKYSDIPIYTPVVLAIDAQSEEESYYKQVPWLIEHLTKGLHNTSDLTLIKNRGVIEWIMNLMNSPFISVKIKTLILKFIERIEAIDQGSDLMITRFGMLSNLEQQSQNYADKDSLLDSQIKLNLDQLMIRLGISVGSSKRIIHWTDNDLPNAIKRVCAKSD
jgi:nucleolar pre-ribosomal-associated protein 1